MFTAIGILSVVLGFSVAIYLMFDRYNKKASTINIFITAAMGVIISILTGAIMVIAIWPPVNVFSWLTFAVFAVVVSWLVLSESKDSKEGDSNVNSANRDRVGVRSDARG